MSTRELRAVGLIGAAIARVVLAQRRLSIDRGLVSACGRAVSLFMLPDALDPLPLARLGRSLSLVCSLLALVSRLLANVCIPLALIGQPVATLSPPVSTPPRRH